MANPVIFGSPEMSLECNSIECLPSMAKALV